MDSLDTEVLKQAHQWLAEGHTVHLATVVKTWGSAPRQAGAMLAVRKVADELEAVVSDDIWPLPTYQEMLFIK